ncbi:MAG: hypothetical protein QXL91_01985 [Candidatus Bathyarchaeia archaeon]
MSEDKAKTEEYMQKLEAYEKEQEKAAKLFNPKELAKKASEIRETRHPTLGIIRYGMIQYKDMAELAKHGESREELTITMLWKMLQKAQPDLTREEVANLPFDVAAELLRLFFKEAGFLATAGKTFTGG